MLIGNAELKVINRGESYQETVVIAMKANENEDNVKWERSFSVMKKNLNQIIIQVTMGSNTISGVMIDDIKVKPCFTFCKYLALIFEFYIIIMKHHLINR